MIRVTTDSVRQKPRSYPPFYLLWKPSYIYFMNQANPNSAGPHSNKCEAIYHSPHIASLITQIVVSMLLPIFYVFSSATETEFAPSPASLTCVINA